MTAVHSSGKQCYSCGDLHRVDHYLCRNCWFRLPRETRRALSRIDELASGRLTELYRAIRRETALEQIAIR